MEIKKNNKRTKFGKFNVSTGARTEKGPLPITRIITKEHSDYKKYFNEDGTKKVIKNTKEKSDQKNEKSENIA